MILQPLLGTFSFAMHSETTRARLLVLFVVVCALVFCGIQYENLAWYDPLVVFFPAGAVWALWIAASLVPARREDRVHAWQSQSSAPPALVVLAAYFGASLLAWVLLAIAFLAELAGARDVSVLQVAVWSLLTALAVIAVALWREAEEPRAERPFRPRALVTVLAITLTIVWMAWGDDADLEVYESEQFGWYFWSLFPRQVSLILATGWIACTLGALHRAAELSANRHSRSLPVAFACFLLWAWLVVMGFSADTDSEHTAVWAFLLVTPFALVAVLLQPETRTRPLHTEPVLTGALFIVFAGAVASLTLAVDPLAFESGLLFDEPFHVSAPWPLAVALYLAAHTMLFLGARAHLGGERRVSFLWLALMITVWVVILPLAAFLQWHYLAVIWLGPPIFHFSEGIMPPAGPALVFGAAQLILACAFAWQSRDRQPPPIASVSRRPVRQESV